MNELKARVVCVDDDVDTCEMVSTLLGYAGYDVLTATTVREGLSLVKHGGCDLILLDGHFPDGSGLDMCQMIRSFDPETPILFYSGTDDTSDIEEAIHAGAQGYLVKPCGMKKLEQTIAQILAKECHSV